MSILLAAAAFAATPETSPHPVLELRQYKIVTGKRDHFVELFDREFLEPQEADGMELVGQFRDRSDPDRFTWIRGFPSMDARKKSLTSFYSGPTWLKHRNSANPMLVDNDNVLLLRPVFGSGFEARSRPTPGTRPSARLIAVTIHYLWKQPEEGFIAFFRDRYAPALRRAGLPIEAALVREPAANNFPRLPVREGEKLFVWATAIDNDIAWKAALARLEGDPQWPALRADLHNLEERPAQRLLLEPTPRSKLR